MRIGTWNVNGIRARAAETLDWIASADLDVVCLQEIKASPQQVPPLLLELPDYWSLWHGATAYSGVALHLKKSTFPESPRFWHPPFDHETRVALAEVGDLSFASLYVPNGGKDFAAKMRFLAEMEAFVKAQTAAGRRLLLCGDLNVTRTDRDVHPKERKPNIIGQRPDERELFERILLAGVVDAGRVLDPDNDQLFTWWAPWRNMRQRNIGWRLDYVLVSASLMPDISRCVVAREVGTSDHAPVVADVGISR